MPLEYVAGKPEKDQVELLLTDAGLKIDRWTEYSFTSHFLTPTDDWSFTVAADRLSAETREALVCGSQVRLVLNNLVQASGFIDTVEVSASKASGTEFRIAGRDRLAQAFDACADPTKSFKEGQTLEDALKTLFAPFGWSGADHFVASNDANRDVKTGGKTGQKLTHGGKKHGPRATRDWRLHQLQPHVREGVYEFAARVTQRFGLHIWSSADGETLIVGRPNFSQEPLSYLSRTASGLTNVIDGSVRFDVSDQPTVLFADGFAGGGPWGTSRVKAIIVNNLVEVVDPSGRTLDPLEPLKQYVDAGARVIQGPTFQKKFRVPRHRVQYLRDDESQTQEHIEFFIRRELARLQKLSLTAHYTVEGHGQFTRQGLVPWTIDTTVAVDDEIAGLSETLYVVGRTFSKSRGAGTTTKLELIRLNTLQFGDENDD